MDDQRSPRAATSERPYLVVSGDAHAGIKMGGAEAHPLHAQRPPRAATSDRPYLVVSGDAHAGPSLEDLRPYCPGQHLEAFDQFADEHRRALAAGKGGWSNGSIAVR